MNVLPSRTQWNAWRDDLLARGPIYFFLLPTVAYGTGFVFFPEKNFVLSSSLHAAMVDLGSKWVPFAWGVMLLVVALGSLKINRWTPTASPFVGFLAWLFATLMYAQDKSYMLVVAVTLPSMLYWFWLYLRAHTANTMHKLKRP